MPSRLSSRYRYEFGDIVKYRLNPSESAVWTPGVIFLGGTEAVGVFRATPEEFLSICDAKMRRLVEDPYDRSGVYANVGLPQDWVFTEHVRLVRSGN